jgi:arginyl-tRNA synthetase
MISPLQAALRAAITNTVTRLYGLDAASLPAIAVEVPPRRALGDLAVPLAFELARRLRKAPRAIAQEIVAGLGPLEGISKAEAAPNGYINVFFDRAGFVRRGLADDGASHAAETSTSAIPRVNTVVEHTAINPNKAAHIGHLRNSALGDTFVRLLRFCGVPVEVQNYIDDTGVQVADVVVGFRELERKSLDEIREIADDPNTKFDYYCWDLYARVTEWYAGDKERLAIRGQALHDIEHGGNESAEIAAFIADRIVRTHLKTMARMNVDYDLLTWEGDILRLKFWARAFEILRESGAMYLQDTGKLKGCWVMKIDEDLAIGESVADASDDAGVEAEADGEENDQNAREKVIVRSNGVVTYVGKDIALQFWKTGLLGRDFHYRKFATRMDGAPLWATTTDATADEERVAAAGLGQKPPHFGAAGMTYNVIDTRQTYLQKLLKQALATLGHVKEAERSHHFSYEMVALSHRTARELGYQDFDESRPFVEVSGRKGLGVKADDLFDRLIAKAHAEVVKRNAELPDDASRKTAEQIAIAAVRYFLIKFTRTKVIAFDIDEALAFEGETGPYLQYSVVRARNIFSKLQEREGLGEAALIARLADTPATPLEGEEGDDLWNLVLEAGRLDEVVEQAVRSLEPAGLAKYAFALAQLFNALYHKYPVLNEERPEFRIWRAAAISYYKRQLTKALELMGASVPARM